jgi:tetratricopeptide (TPR) repeat protein
MASLVCFLGGLRDVRLFRAAHAHLEGVQRVQSGDYRGGLVLLERSRALFPKDVMNAYELGNTHAQLSQWALQQGLDQTFVQHGNQALDAYSLALAANPGYDEIHYNRARVAYSLGRSTESVQGFRMALAINPTHKDAYRALGSLYERNVPTDPRTEELFERAVFYFPEEPEFQIGLDRTRRRAEQTPPPTNVSTRALP